jgi:2-dehydropantoate 2-reductase
MGLLLAGRLARAGYEVRLVDHRADRATALAASPMVLVEPDGDHRFLVPVVTRAADVGVVDLVVIATKAYDTAQAAADAGPLVGEATTVLSLQNGLGNVETLVERFGAERVIGGVTAQGATLLDQGRVRHAGEGETVVAPAGETSLRLADVAAALNRAGLPTNVSRNLEGLVWSKAIVNAAINPVGALTRLRNGDLIAHPETRSLMESVVVEAATVAVAAGITLVDGDPWAKTQQVCAATAENVNSLLQDVRRARRTEIEYINGAIVARGETVGTPAPVNRALADLVRTMERTYDRQVDRREGSILC